MLYSKYIIKITRYEYNNTHTETLADIGRECLEFDSVAEAVDYVTAEFDGYDGPNATINSDGVKFSPDLRELPHNCYSAPDYEIVNKSTGRSNAEIRAAITASLA